MRHSSLAKLSAALTEGWQDAATIAKRAGVGFAEALFYLPALTGRGKAAERFVRKIDRRTGWSTGRKSEYRLP
jgi:hypothetical protein